MDLSVRQRNLKRSLTCPICLKLFTQLTIIQECSHRFCYKCITKKINEEGLHNCPLCKVDLGCSPLQSLRIDNGWQSIMEKLNESNTEDIESGVRRKVLREGSHGVTSAHATMRNEKQYFSENNMEKKREIRKGEKASKWHPVEGKKGKEFTPNIQAFNPPLQQSGEEEVTKGNKKHGTFWFSLVASNNQKSKAPLEQIPSKYLRVKDANITVSCIKKYLMQKLNLGSENEVEISLEGRVLLPGLEMWKLVDLWSHTTAASQRKPAFIGSSAHDFVFTLTYASRPKST